MGAVRVSPIRVNDKFAVLTGVSLDIFQELHMAIKSGPRKRIPEGAGQALQGRHGLWSAPLQLEQFAGLSVLDSSVLDLPRLW